MRVHQYYYRRCSSAGIQLVIVRYVGPVRRQLDAWSNEWALPRLRLRHGEQANDDATAVMPHFSKHNYAALTVEPGATSHQ